VSKTLVLSALAVVISPAAPLLYYQHGTVSFADVPFTMTETWTTAPLSSSIVSMDKVMVPDIQDKTFTVHFPFTLTIPAVNLPADVAIESVTLTTEADFGIPSTRTRIGPEEIVSVLPVQELCPAPPPLPNQPCPYTPFVGGPKYGLTALFFKTLPAQEQLMQSVRLNQPILLNGEFQFGIPFDYPFGGGYNSITTFRYSGVITDLHTRAFVGVMATPAAIPEPATPALFCLGLLWIGCVKLYRR
jgi:hypothetical protein